MWPRPRRIPLRGVLLLVLSIGVTAALTVLVAHFVGGGSSSDETASFRTRTGRGCLDHAPRLDVEPGPAWRSFWRPLSEEDCRPGSWLYQYRESGQNLGIFESEMDAPVAARDVLLLRELEPLDDARAAELLDPIGEFLSIYFQRDLELGTGLPLAAAAFRPEQGARGQYDAQDLLDALVGTCPPGVAGCMAVTDEDLFVRDLQYIFGLGHFRERVGVMSTYRLWEDRRDARTGVRTAPGRSEPLRRALKVAVHEMSHQLGVAHCIHYKDCVMAGTNSLAESDRGHLMLCPLDHEKLRWRTGFDPHRRFTELAAFAARKQLHKEAAYWTRMAEEYPALPNAAGAAGP